MSGYTEDHLVEQPAIHKFRTEAGTLHPVLSVRDDIIMVN